MGSPHPRAGPFRAALDIEASGDLALRLGTARLPARGGSWDRGVPGDWLAARLGEKLTRWSSTTADGQPAFDRDHQLATLTLYWTTRTAASSLLPYWAYRHAPGSALPADDPGPVPVAIDVFGGEIVPFPKPPRELAERYFHVSHWAEHDRGGHFPAVAEPRLLADRLREAFRPCRGA